MNEPAIEVKDVHVRYRSMKSFSLRKSLGQIRQRRDSYEALRGVSFTVPKGKIIGIIGKNGSGKSTLLKTIAGVFSPDEGTIDTFGNRLSLLAILFASVSGAAWAVFLLLRRGAGRKTAFPFGPFLAAGMGLSLLWGEELVGWYLSLFLL